mgnify:CR=1 FL=1
MTHAIKILEKELAHLLWCQKNLKTVDESAERQIEQEIQSVRRAIGTLNQATTGGK